MSIFFPVALCSNKFYTDHKNMSNIIDIVAILYLFLTYTDQLNPFKRMIDE